MIVHKVHNELARKGGVSGRTEAVWAVWNLLRDHR